MGVIGTTIITMITTAMDITRDTAMVQLIRLLSRATITTSACTPGLGFPTTNIPRNASIQLPTKDTSTIFTLRSMFLATDSIVVDRQSTPLDIASRLAMMAISKCANALFTYYTYLILFF